MSNSKRHHEKKQLGKKQSVEAKSPGQQPLISIDLLRSLIPKLLISICAILLLSTPFFPAELPAATGDGLMFASMTLGLLVCTLTAYLLRIGPTRMISVTWPDLLVLAFWGWVSIATFIAIRSESPGPAIVTWWVWTGMIAVYYLVRMLFCSARSRRMLITLMIGIAVGLSTYGLYQTFVEIPATQRTYEADPDTALRQAGIWAPEGSPQRDLFENRLYSPEPIGTFALTNSLAGLLAPSLILLLGIVILGPMSETANWKIAVRVMSAIGCLSILIGICLLLTQSRSGCGAALVGVAILVMIRLLAYWRERTGSLQVPITIGLAVVLLGVAGIVGGIATGLLNRELVTEASKSFGYRVQYWQSTNQMIADRPIFGVGPGNFRYAYTQYKLPEASEEIADPHNFMYEIAAMAGLPALMLFIALLLVTLWQITRKETPDECENTDTDPTNRSLTDADQQRLERIVLIAGTAAFGLLALLWLGTHTSTGLPLTGLLFGIPATAITLWWLYPWTQSGSLPTSLLVAGTAVLLINLLAAGGIGAPGVAYMFWIFTALAVNQSLSQSNDQANCQANNLPSRKFVVPLSGKWIAIPAVLVGIAMLGSLSSTWKSNQTRIALYHAQQGSRVNIRAIEKAVQDDPNSVEARTALTELLLQQWAMKQQQNAEKPAETAWKRYEASRAQLIKICPRSSSIRTLLASREAEAYRETGDPKQLQIAIEDFRRAIQLYPNNARLRADAALLASVSPEYQEISETNAQRAIELDAITPHSDKKLDNPVRETLIRLLEK